MWPRSLLRLMPSCLVLAALVAAPLPAHAAVPASLNYDGTLYTAAGKPLATGRYDFKFSLYTAATGGEPVWTETHTKVQVNNGEFHAVLGKGNPSVPLDVPFDQQYYLGVSVDGTPELLPRVELMPTPYSFHSRLAQQVADGAVTGSKIANEAVTDDKIKSVSWSKITGVNGTSGVPAAVWSLKGNYRSDPGGDFIGTTDAADLTFRTSNLPRFSIRSNGVGEFLSDFQATGVFTSRPTMQSGAFLFGDRTVGIERPPFTSDMRLFGPQLGSFVFDGGNVGIGVQDPLRRLEVDGDVGISQNLIVEQLARMGEGQVRGNLTVDGITRLTSTASSGGATNGALVVSGGAGIGENLNVQGAARVSGALDVTGATRLRGTLGVTGTTEFENTTDSEGSGSGGVVMRGGLGLAKNLNIGKDLLVSGKSTFTGPMAANGGGSFGSLAVTGGATIGGDITGNSGLTVAGGASAKQVTAGTDGMVSNGPSSLNGQVTIAASVTGGKDAASAYPLRVQGSAQGILIEVTDGGSGQPNKSNQFVSFRDATNHKEHGRISGLTKNEQESERSYKYQKASLGIQTALAGVDLARAIGQTIASAVSSTSCLGFGACVTLPIPSLIIASVSEVVIATAGLASAGLDLDDWLTLQAQSVEGGGVTYSSAAADYAEWLPKADPAEELFPGDVVGVRHGRVSKRTEGAEMLMVVSTRPMVLGNTPPEGRESEFVKVAFMGQVPVTVFGVVDVGDYILASGHGDGRGMARRASDLEPRHFAQIVGVAWTGNKGIGLGSVNLAVGLDRTSTARLAQKQQELMAAQAEELKSVRGQVERTNAVLARLVPGFDAAMGGVSPAAAPSLAPTPDPAASPFSNGLHADSAAEPPVATLARAASGPLVSHYDVQQGLEQAAEHLRRTGATPENNPILRQLVDPAMRERLQREIELRLNGAAAAAR